MYPSGQVKHSDTRSTIGMVSSATIVRQRGLLKNSLEGSLAEMPDGTPLVNTEPSLISQIWGFMVELFFS